MKIITLCANIYHKRSKKWEIMKNAGSGLGWLAKYCSYNFLTNNFGFPTKFYIPMDPEIIKF